MKIAFISYEYPPDTAKGGIATYVYSVASMLQTAGHTVEVFAGTHQDTSYSTIADGVHIHRIKVQDRKDFASMVAHTFCARHQQIKFDVLESAEYYADAYHVIRAVPDIPLVIKLHTPKFLISKLNLSHFGLPQKIRFLAGGVIRGKINKPFWVYKKQNDIEYHHIQDADEIVTPSKDLRRIVSSYWGISASQIYHIPNLYIPRDELLTIPVNTATNTITYIGRLEIRKGVHILADTIPTVIRSFPKARFRFIGRDLPSPQHGVNMKEYVSRKLGAAKDHVEFIDQVPNGKIIDWLAQTDICVFPSLWENFPYVCLEAMSAGRGIVASDKGGMHDMLSETNCGILATPDNTATFSQGIIKLLKNPEYRIQLGESARNRILQSYGRDVILKLQIESYSRAIERRKKLGARTFQHQASLC